MRFFFLRSLFLSRIKEGRHHKGTRLEFPGSMGPLLGILVSGSMAPSTFNDGLKTLTKSPKGHDFTYTWGPGKEHGIPTLSVLRPKSLT